VFKNRFLLPAMPYWIWAILEFILFWMASLVFMVWVNSGGSDWFLLLACLPPIFVVVPLGITIIVTGQVRLWGFRRIIWLALLIVVVYGIKDLPGYPPSLTLLFAPLSGTNLEASVTGASMVLLAMLYGIFLIAFMHYVVRCFSKKWSTSVRMV